MSGPFFFFFLQSEAFVQKLKYVHRSAATYINYDLRHSSICIQVMKYSNVPEHFVDGAAESVMMT